MTSIRPISHMVAAALAFGVGVADAWWRHTFGLEVDLGLMAIGIGALGLDAAGILPRPPG